MIRVLLVDDSALSRRLFAQALNAASDVEVVGEAGDPFAARDLIVELRPDVVVLDVEMPRMDGISFLTRLMHYCPMPVIVCSSLTAAGGETALRAFDAGAVEVICKPSDSEQVAQAMRDLVAAVRLAAHSRPKVFAPATVRPRPLAAPSPTREPRASVAPRATLSPRRERAIEVVAIGASTGGTVAVERIVRALPRAFPALLIAQHMPAYITQAFAKRLAQLAEIEVEEAQDGRVLREGLALVAPGGTHLVVERVGAQLRAVVREGPRVNGHRPSVDVLFRSVADTLGDRAVGVLLTGMGRDGAQGLLSMRNAGAHTFAQDEASSAVWGMPKAALELQAASDVVALNDMATSLRRAVQ